MAQRIEQRRRAAAGGIQLASPGSMLIASNGRAAARDPTHFEHRQAQSIARERRRGWQRRLRRCRSGCLAGGAVEALLHGLCSDESKWGKRGRRRGSGSRPPGLVGRLPAAPGCVAQTHSAWWQAASWAWGPQAAAAGGGRTRGALQAGPGTPGLNRDGIRRELVAHQAQLQPRGEELAFKHVPTWLRASAEVGERAPPQPRSPTRLAAHRLRLGRARRSS